MANLGEFIDDYLYDSLTDLKISKETLDVLNKLNKSEMVPEKVKDLCWSFYKFSDNYIHSSSKVWRDEGPCQDWRDRMHEIFPDRFVLIERVYNEVKEISRHLDFCMNDTGDEKLAKIVKARVKQLSQEILHPLFEGEEMYLKWKSSGKSPEIWMQENRGGLTSKRFGF